MINIAQNVAKEWQCHKIHISNIDQWNPLCTLLERHMSTYSAPFMGCTTKLYTILPKIPWDKSCLSISLDKNTDTSAEVNLSYGVGLIGVIYVYDFLQRVFLCGFSWIKMFKFQWKLRESIRPKVICAVNYFLTNMWQAFTWTNKSVHRHICLNQVALCWCGNSWGTCCSMWLWKMNR